MRDLQRPFKLLDTNNDGCLSKAELLGGYNRIYEDHDQAIAETERVFRKIDMDGSGLIDYSEWVVATIDKQKLLTNEKL